MLSASEEERAEKLGLTSPLSQRTCSQGSQNGDHELYAWLLDADLNLPMLLCVDGEIEQLESTTDVQRELFETNNVDIYKTPAKLSGDTQANDLINKGCGFMGGHADCKVISSLYGTDVARGDAPEVLMEAIEAGMKPHFSPAMMGMISTYFSHQPRMLAKNYSRRACIDGWEAGGMGVHVDKEKMWSHFSRWHDGTLSSEEKEYYRAGAAQLEEVFEDQGYFKTEQMTAAGFPPPDLSDPVIKEYLSRGRQGPGAIAIEDRPDHEGFAMLMSHSGSRERRKAKKDLSAQRKEEQLAASALAVQRRAEKEAGVKSKKGLRTKMPCSNKKNGRCEEVYGGKSQVLGSAQCDKCGIWFCHLAPCQAIRQAHEASCPGP